MAKIKARIVETSDITIEEFLNRICVFNNPQLLDISDRYVITDEDFNNDFHKIVFGAIYKLHELGAKEITLENNLMNKYNIIIPTKNLNELIRMFKEEDEQIELHIFNNKIIFKFDSIEMLSRLINGEYPDTSKLIPQDFSLIIDVNLKDFFNAIDRASLLTSENDKNTIRFETKNDQVIISSNIPEIGYVEETLNIKKNNNEELKIAFSSKYMLDALRAMESEEISLMFNGDIKPIILKNPKNDNLLQLILPIRTY